MNHVEIQPFPIGGYFEFSPFPASLVHSEISLFLLSVSFNFSSSCDFAGGSFLERVNSSSVTAQFKLDGRANKHYCGFADKSVL